MMKQSHTPQLRKRISAIVVTYNGAPWIETCLESLLRSRYPVEVIVIDNASTDKTAALVRNFAPVAWVSQRRNLGFGKASNIGIGMALAQNADMVFLVNQDVRVHPDAIGQLARVSQDHGELGVLSPLQLTGDGTAIEPSFAQYLALSRTTFFSDMWAGRAAPFYTLRSVNAAAWLITRECLNAVGGFDPVFFMYGEDDDYCSRAVLHNFGVGLVPSALVFHHHTSSPPEGRWGGFRRRLNRRRSQLLVALKSPNHSLARQTLAVSLQALHDGTLALFDGDLKTAVVQCLVLGKTFSLLPTIWRHRRVCLVRGRHWIMS